MRVEGHTSLHAGGLNLLNAAVQVSRSFIMYGQYIRSGFFKGINITFRYLATIGGFALDPYEEAFPKIRNPKLIGVCCKHMVKTIGIMQSPLIRKRVEAEM